MVKYSLLMGNHIFIYQNSKHSAWILSSVSESCPDNSLIKEDELSELTSSQFQGRENDEIAVQNSTDAKSRKISNKKSPKKPVKSKVCSSTKEKINSDTNKVPLLEGEKVIQ